MEVVLSTYAFPNYRANLPPGMFGSHEKEKFIDRVNSLTVSMRIRWRRRGQKQLRESWQEIREKKSGWTELRLYKKQSVVVVWKRRWRRDEREAILIFWQTCDLWMALGQPRQQARTN